jgi:hypothetical protein
VGQNPAMLATHASRQVSVAAKSPKGRASATGRTCCRKWPMHRTSIELQHLRGFMLYACCMWCRCRASGMTPWCSRET